jgi:hypothetical protein
MRAQGIGWRAILALAIGTVTACSVVFSLDGYAGKTMPEAGSEGGVDAGIDAGPEANVPPDANASADANADADASDGAADGGVDAGPDCGGPPPVLVAYWKVDEGEGGVVHDSSDSGILGTLANGPTWVAGPSPGLPALFFDGTSNQFVDFGDPVPLHLTGAMTISAHVNLAAFPDGGDDQPILSKRGGDRGWELYVSDQEIVFDVASSSTTYKPALYGAGLPINEWHHVVAVYDPSVPGLYEYLDGLDAGALFGPAATDAGGVPDAQYNSGNNVHLGNAADCTGVDAGPCSSGQMFNGAVYEVRVYASALNQCQVQAIP